MPIIAMSANAFDEDKKQALKAGMDGYISKPIDMEKLQSQIIEILKEKAGS
ncbi:response regulator [Holdemanella sp.]|uniref:response regulator n=1 Tax=Holdemanella sp. TaxID=1971762 RepID=UPI003076D94D